MICMTQCAAKGMKAKYGYIIYGCTTDLYEQIGFLRLDLTFLAALL